jgi:hypothetical protein
MKWRRLECEEEKENLWEGMWETDGDNQQHSSPEESQYRPTSERSPEGEDHYAVTPFTAGEALQHPRGFPIRVAPALAGGRGRKDGTRQQTWATLDLSRYSSGHPTADRGRRPPVTASREEEGVHQAA